VKQPASSANTNFSQDLSQNRLDDNEDRFKVARGQSGRRSRLKAGKTSAAEIAARPGAAEPLHQLVPSQSIQPFAPT
jgi:hypothetical protein